MLWEREPQASVPTAFSSSLKLARVFLQLDRNTENSLSFAEMSAGRTQKRSERKFSTACSMVVPINR